MLISQWFAATSAIVLIALVVLLIDDSYGWRKMIERIRSVFSQDHVNDVIELGNMNQPNQVEAAQQPNQNMTVSINLQIYTTSFRY